MDVEALLKSRLFSLFNDSPNIQNLLEIIADPLQDSVDVLDYILDHKSIDDAEGEQLDKLAAKIGLKRPRKQETKIFTLCREGEVQDPDLSFQTDEQPGGYLGTLEGLEDQSDLTANMSDVDFRFLIRQKAASIRSEMTRLNLFSYLLAFGAQCKLDDDTIHIMDIDPVRYDDLNQWTRNYIETRGFKPGTLTVRFVGTTRHGDSI